MKATQKFAQVGARFIPVDAATEAEGLVEWSVETRPANSGTAIRTDTLTPKVIAELIGDSVPSVVKAVDGNLRDMAYCLAFAEVNFLTVVGPDVSISGPTRETIQALPESVLVALVNATDPRAPLRKQEATDLAKKLAPTLDKSTTDAG